MSLNHPYSHSPEGFCCCYLFEACYSSVDSSGVHLTSCWLCLSPICSCSRMFMLTLWLLVNFNARMKQFSVEFGCFILIHHNYSRDSPSPSLVDLDIAAILIFLLWETHPQVLRWPCYVSQLSSSAPAPQINLLQLSISPMSPDN